MGLATRATFCEAFTSHAELSSAKDRSFQAYDRSAPVFDEPTDDVLNRQGFHLPRYIRENRGQSSITSFSRVRKIEIDKSLLEIIQFYSDHPETGSHTGVLVTAAYFFTAHQQIWLHGGVLRMSQISDTMAITLPCVVTVSWGH